MKKILLSCLVLGFIFVLTDTVNADTYVRGYTRSNGTYVQPHYRSDADGSVNNNWSTKGNVNPYTGSKGYKNPDKGASFSGNNSNKSYFGNNSNKSYFGNSYNNRNGFFGN